MRGGWVYIMTNRPNGTLYTGVTSDIGRRAYEHREGLVKGFTKRYGLKRLVHIEFYETISAAIQRESNTKHWPRAWKAPTSAPKTYIARRVTCGKIVTLLRIMGETASKA
jgi:putative endonuclease